MVEIGFRNIQCLREGTIKVKEKALNVKYSYNGFGKSSLAKAIYYGIEEPETIDALTPYRGGEPTIKNLGAFNSCLLFNEEFVNNTLFQDDDLIEGSYDVFVVNKDLQEKETKLNVLLGNLNKSLNNTLINNFKYDAEQILGSLVLNKGGDDFDKRKTGYKGLSKAPSIETAALKTSVKEFGDNIVAESLVQWLGWHKEGHKYLANDKCPFCNGQINAKQKDYVIDVDNLVEGMDFKNNKAAREVISNKVVPYVPASVKPVIKELLNDPTLESKKKTALIDSLKTINKESSKISTLKKLELSHGVLPDKTSLKTLLLDCVLDEKYFADIGDSYKIAALEVNSSIKELVKSIDIFLDGVKAYKKSLENAIRQSEEEINSFLKTAGIPYKFHIDLLTSDDAVTKLTPIENVDYEMDDIRGHLSFGERNALSVALFGALVKSSDIDLVILDDPISSFDENKKFAIMNYFFNKDNGVLKDNTTILFTHDFEPIIEVKNNVVDFSKKERHVTVLTKNSGVVSEIVVSKNDLINAFKYEEEMAANESLEEYVRLIHLRKMYELKFGCSGDAYDIMSSAEHLRPKPSDKKHQEYEASIVNNGVSIIRNYIKSFSYNDFVTKYNLEKLIDLYNRASTKMDKLIILRAIDEIADLEIKESNPILYNFMSINFHVESLYLYQIKGIDFVPQFVIDLCDSIVGSLTKS